MFGRVPDLKCTDKKHVSIARVNDIFDALAKLGDADKFPEFAASNFRRLPERQPEEMNFFQIVQRITDLEKSWDLHADALSISQ